MSVLDPRAEESFSTIGNSLRHRPLVRKRLSEMMEEELELMIRRRASLATVNSGRLSVR